MQPSASIIGNWAANPPAAFARRFAARIGGVSLGISSESDEMNLIPDAGLNEFLAPDARCEMEFEAAWSEGFGAPPGNCFSSLAACGGCIRMAMDTASGSPHRISASNPISRRAYRGIFAAGELNCCANIFLRRAESTRWNIRSMNCCGFTGWRKGMARKSMAAAWSPPKDAGCCFPGIPAREKALRRVCGPSCRMRGC